jgi:CheY-like chemotaxis protein/two-component sensor histidine kinase
MRYLTAPATVTEVQTVLLVEDDSRLAEVVSSVLTLAGYRPIVIAEHALIPHALATSRPRCVIMDGELNALGHNRSWADAAAIRRGHPEIPVLMMTADSAALAEAKARRSTRSRAAGFAGFVGKPFEVERLLATLSRVLEAPAPAYSPGDDGIAVFPDITRPVAIDPPEVHLFDTVVHELRQPLTVIRGQLQLGRRHIRTDPDRVHTAIDLSIAQVDRMTRLLGDLLDSARLAANALELRIVPVDLASVVAAAVGTHESGDVRRITFRWSHGPVLVMADADRITQILANLLSNAIKYSQPELPIEVSLTLKGPEVEVRVADHGLGIPADELAGLFTPFYRASSAVSVAGTGLGLHISRRLAERQGGRLWLEASSGAGSVFALALPVA